MKPPLWNAPVSPVRMVEGRADNIKVTRPEDLPGRALFTATNARRRHDPIHPQRSRHDPHRHGFDETDFRIEEAQV